MPVNAGETINDTIDFEGLLKGDELATGTPVVTFNPAGLTISLIAVNTANQVVEGRIVLPGEGVDYRITGFVTGLYKVEITITTDASSVRIGEAWYEVCG